MNDAVALVLSKSVEAYDTAAGGEAFDTPAFFAAVANFVGKQEFVSSLRACLDWQISGCNWSNL